ncbi:MAG TPA: tyrosine decarboxylase MfnA [Candidatus Thermoplasmatota archaeon]|nr:tyrosine decarboxylase MfnA [Candidatus Thermoplasmatota archaeon]
MQDEGWSLREVRKALKEARGRDFSFGDPAAKQGAILGSMCTAPHEVAAEASAMFLETNLGDPGHFPGTARLEQEVLADLLSLLHAPAGAAGRYLTGGTEANLLACWLAREKTGRRTIVLPDSAHFSFQKAARILGMRLVHVPTLPTGHADPVAMARAVTKDTALMVAVAGTTELGLVDPIEELGAVATAKGVLLHVDAAYGGYILPFLAEATRTPKPFDFQVVGVWSLAMDPHKMGMATIPGGALLLRDGADWSLTAVESPYVSTDTQSTLMGTRPGAAVAAAWAVHRHLGRTGFASLVETCLDNAAFLAASLQEMGVELAANPETAVVTFKADDPDELSRALAAKGFRVNVVPRMSAIRIVVNPHVTRDLIRKFLAALKETGA